MQKALNFMIGMVAGALLGSAVTLLMTPMSGNQVRADLQTYRDQMKNEIELAAQTRRAELEKQLARLRGEIVSE